jgi:hypothetical protein
MVRVEEASMNGRRIRSALRCALSYASEGLTWTGMMAGMNAAVAVEVTIRARNAAMPQQRPVIPLSNLERTEWAALVERLR